MDITKEKSSLNTNSGTESKFIEIEVPLTQVDVKIERESEELEIEIELLYTDHVIKEEMVIGPTVLQEDVHCNSNCPKDEHLRKKPKLDENIYQQVTQREITKETGAQEEITVADADILRHKKPRLQTQEETTDRQENTENDTEAEITSIVDSKTEAAAYIQTEQEEKIKRVTKKSGPSNKSKTQRKIQVEDKNVNRVKSDNIFTCDDSSERFKRKRQLKQNMEAHAQSKHKIYLKCKECTYQTVTRDSLERHKKLHDKSRHYVCDVCGYRFKYNGKLKTHLRDVHSGEKINYCTVCEYRCNRQSSLTQHMKIHTGEKPFSCTMCEYRCTQKSTLTHHLKTHTGEKPFSCSVCEYRSSHKSNLTQHMRVHTGEKPFSCSVCDYRCNHKVSLTQHMKLHTAEKPFSCTLCEYRCARKDALTKHIDKIHK